MTDRARRRSRRLVGSVLFITVGDFEAYVMSPCCLSPRGAGPPNSDLEKTLATAGQNHVLPFFSRSLCADAGCT